jgi:DNA topoisomerase II
LSILLKEPIFVRFIVEKCDGRISVENKKKRAMIDELLEKKYDSDPIKAWRREIAKNLDEEEEEQKKGKDQDEDEVEEGRDFDYILGMKMWNLTKEKKEALLGERDKKLKEVKDLEAKSPDQLWLDDLDGLSAAVSFFIYVKIHALGLKFGRLVPIGAWTNSFEGF